MDCPHSIYDDPAIRNRYINHTVVNSTIPAVTTELFTSGTRNGTVANLLDIQFRAYNLANDWYVDNNATRAVGRLEVLPSMILNPGYYLVNGLVVDAFRGGIGIRNHTIPKGVALGATWTEDILWIIPETQCTNTNLSLHFSVNDGATSMAGDNGYLQDDGGFSDISPEVPQPPWNVGDQWKKVASTPQLKRSADILAWWNNQFVAQALNLTSSEKGAFYTEEFVTYGQLSSPGVIKISSMDGMFMDSLYYDKNSSAQMALANKFKDYGTGYYDDDRSVSGKPFMQCGYLYSIPEPQNLHLGQSWRPDPGSPWQQSLYTCASSVSATIKEVTFTTNGSTAFQALQVVKVQDKNYTAANLPLWGIEKVDPKKYQVWDVYKFWGLIDESVKGSPDVDVHKASKVYLPAAVRGPTLGNHMYDSFAAGGVFTAAWNSIYSLAAALGDVNEDKVPSYSGTSNYGLTLKWRQLVSQAAPGAETLLNLIWTDLITFTIVGTRTGFETMGDIQAATDDKNSDSLGVRPVHKHERSIRYGDIRYAIPAFVVGAFFLVTLVISLLMCCFQRRMWSALNHYMNQTSMGRAATQAMLHGAPDEISAYASTKVWSHQAKHIMLHVPPPPNKWNKKTSNVVEGGEPNTAQVSHRFTPVTKRHHPSDDSKRSRVAYTAVVEHSSADGSPAVERPEMRPLQQRTW
ncbi:hypothetical protein H2200_007913 [Cladophialophora chaetospira]|uniref:Uncharacterized protein n=1 Tax=Cladophialophora chaetospira TaxID=386627 RepID=A0AA38X6U0_9EURO|nr:hypothetical protein H2200_007913 [Cladophialophora chaetospira]